MVSMTPSTFADHSEITITPVPDSDSPYSDCDVNGCYDPNTATVEVGDTVIFSNTNDVPHTFSSGIPSDDVIGTEFNSGMLGPGDSAEWIPENFGEFSYFDMIHPWMQGLIIVLNSTGPHNDVVEEAVEETVVEEAVEETVVATQESEEEGGGCLIATAAYGSEMAPQVQLLREIRDNQLMNTESGSAFMSGFNEMYYSFSPIIADMQRENPMFKEAVKLGLTPMLSSLAIMENANSESEVLGLGLSVIALNLGMYLGIPAIVVIGIKKRI